MVDRAPKAEGSELAPGPVDALDLAGGPPEPPPPRDPLLRLQDLDHSIDRLASRLSALEDEEDIREARTRASQVEGQVGELRLSVDDVAREQRRLEADLESLERKIEAERHRLYDGSVVNAKELQSIEAEVTGLQGRRSRLEDQLLERMEQRENLEARLHPLEEDLTRARRRVTEVEGTSARELGDVRRDLEERRREREELAPLLDEELLDLYEELRRSKKGVGAAALVDGVCQGCHQKLSAVYLDRLKRQDGIRRCEYCRRILVLA